MTKPVPRIAIAGFGVAVLGFLLLIVGLASGAQVNAGHVGVVAQWGAIDKNQQPLAPGFHFVTPFVTHIEPVSVQQQNHSFREVATASKELQNVYVDGGINYHVTPGEAAGLTINGGEEAYVQRIFNPAFQDYIKEEIPHYSTQEILLNRAKIRDAVLAKLREKAADPSVNYHVTVDDLFITDIHFDKGYTAAIEASAEAQQALNKAKIDAQTRVAQAQGDADAQVAKAKASQQANELQKQSLTPDLLQLLQVQNQAAAIAKWNGQLPATELSGSIPFIVNPK